MSHRSPGLHPCWGRRSGQEAWARLFSGTLQSHTECLGDQADCKMPTGESAASVWAWLIRPRMKRVLGLMWPLGFWLSL